MSYLTYGIGYRLHHGGKVFPDIQPQHAGGHIIHRTATITRTAHGHAYPVTLRYFQLRAAMRAPRAGIEHQPACLLTSTQRGAAVCMQHVRGFQRGHIGRIQVHTLPPSMSESMRLGLTPALYRGHSTPTAQSGNGRETPAGFMASRHAQNAHVSTRRAACSSV